jgi:hypothetical protein
MLILIVGFLFFASTQSASNGKQILNGISQTVVLILCSGSGIALLGIAMMGSLRDDISNKRVLSVEGVVECSRYSHKGEHHYRVSLGRKSFIVPEHVYKAFIDRETYRLYYLPLSETLVAAEHQSGPIPTFPAAPPDTSNPLTTPSSLS